jgi:hypothetical protein
LDHVGCRCACAVTVLIVEIHRPAWDGFAVVYRGWRWRELGSQVRSELQSSRVEYSRFLSESEYVLFHLFNRFEFLCHVLSNRDEATPLFVENPIDDGPRRDYASRRR